MDHQMIIVVSREFGSGGHVIAQKIADHYGLPVYDHNLLREISDQRKLDFDELDKYDEVPRVRFVSRTVRGYNNSPEANIAQMQFDFLKKKADEGESFVVVGRCAESLLKGNSGLIAFFVLADPEAKVARTAKTNDISLESAQKLNENVDRRRKRYHNYYCEIKWGDSRNYDLCVNSSRLGIDATADYLIDFIDRRQAAWADEADA